VTERRYQPEFVPPKARRRSVDVDNFDKVGREEGREGGGDYGMECPLSYARRSFTTPLFTLLPASVPPFLPPCTSGVHAGGVCGQRGAYNAHSPAGGAGEFRRIYVRPPGWSTSLRREGGREGRREEGREEGCEVGWQWRLHL